MDLASSSVQSMQLLFDVVCAASVLERTCNKALYLSEMHSIWSKRSIITTLYSWTPFLVRRGLFLSWLGRGKKQSARGLDEILIDPPFCKHP